MKVSLLKTHLKASVDLLSCNKEISNSFLVSLRMDRSGDTASITIQIPAERTIQMRDILSLQMEQIRNQTLIVEESTAPLNQ